MLRGLGLVGTIAEGDEGPEEPESGDSEDEEVGPARFGSDDVRPARFGSAGSRVSLQEVRPAPGPGRRGAAGGDFSAAFVFGEVEAGGEGAWAAALRQLRGKVSPAAGGGIATRSSGLLSQHRAFVFLPRNRLPRWMRRLRK